MLSEDVKDQPGAINHLHFHDVFELSQLARAQLTITDNRVGLGQGQTDAARLEAEQKDRRISSAAPRASA